MDGLSQGPISGSLNLSPSHSKQQVDSRLRGDLRLYRHDFLPLRGGAVPCAGEECGGRPQLLGLDGGSLRLPEPP